MAPVPQPALPFRRHLSAQGIAHCGPGVGAAGGVLIIINTKPNVFDHFNRAGVAADPGRSFGDAFPAPGDLFRIAPVQAGPVGQLAGQPEHLRPQSAQIYRSLGWRINVQLDAPQGNHVALVVGLLPGHQSLYRAQVIPHH